MNTPHGLLFEPALEDAFLASLANSLTPPPGRRVFAFDLNHDGLYHEQDGRGTVATGEEVRSLSEAGAEVIVMRVIYG